MPELPEVETVARGLQISVAGRRIVSVTLRKTDFMDDPDTIEREVPGTQIARVERFGKFMLLQLVRERVASEPAAKLITAEASPQALHVRLGMTAKLAPNFAQQPRAQHTAAALAFH